LEIVTRAVAQSIGQNTTLVAFFTLFGLFAFLLPDTFLTGRNLFNISQQVSMLAVTAFAMTIVMVMGDYDLSVGSMASLVGIAAAVIYRESGSESVSVIAALGIGILGGMLNGVLVSYINILPFVATLGTLTIFSGTAFLIAGGKTLFGGEIPATLVVLAKSGIPLFSVDAVTLHLPYLTLVALIALLFVWFILQKMVFGRHLHAIGGNTEAARLSGIDVRRLRMMAFTLSGLGAAVAGLMYMGRVASANPTQGSGLMLDAIAAVFIGMTISKQGEPKVMNTLVGVLFLGILSNGLTQLNVDSYVRDVLVGSLIIMAVATSGLERLRRN